MNTLDLTKSESKILSRVSRINATHMKRWTTFAFVTVALLAIWDHYSGFTNNESHFNFWKVLTLTMYIGWMYEVPRLYSIIQKLKQYSSKARTEVNSAEHAPPAGRGEAPRP